MSLSPCHILLSAMLRVSARVSGLVRRSLAVSVRVKAPGQQEYVLDSSESDEVLQISFNGLHVKLFDGVSHFQVVEEVFEMLIKG